MLCQYFFICQEFASFLSFKFANMDFYLMFILVNAIVEIFSVMAAEISRVVSKVVEQYQMNGKSDSNICTYFSLKKSQIEIKFI